VCTPRRVSRSSERVQGPCLFIRPRVIMRCARVWVRTRAEIFRSALPARLINDIFERRDATRAYVHDVYAYVRRGAWPARKFTLDGSGAEPKKQGRVPSIIIYRLRNFVMLWS